MLRSRGVKGTAVLVMVRTMLPQVMAMFRM